LGKLDRGDTVFVWLETHIQTSPAGDLFLGTDTAPGTPPRPAVSATEVSDTLGELAGYGCRVVLLLDCVHQNLPAEARLRFINWVRDLSYTRGVITFVASTDGPSQRRDFDRLGVFAKVVTESFSAEGRARARAYLSPDAPLTLSDFSDIVADGVEALTGRKQFVRAYVPPQIPGSIQPFEPSVLSTPVAHR
jgi:hypothetical protein